MKGLVSRALTSRLFDIICRIVLSGVFIYASVGKIAAPDRFADAVLAYRVIPMPLTNIVAIVLPWIELFAGLALIPNSLAKSGGLILAGLNLVFLVAAGSAMARGLDISCGCFSTASVHARVGWDLIARDLILLVLCLPIMFRASNNINPE